MRIVLATLVAAIGCNQDVGSIKNDAGDPADEILTPKNTFWETTDFKTDTKLQLNMNLMGSEFDSDGNVVQTFSWDHLTPTSIEIFMCTPAPCVLQGLNEIAFSSGDKFTAKILPQNTVMAAWKLVQSSTFP